MEHQRGFSFLFIASIHPLMGKDRLMVFGRTMAAVAGIINATRKSL